MDITRTKVIIINGTPRVGKDTFVNAISEYYDVDESVNVFNISSVDPIKQMLISFGWDGTKTDKVRNIIAGIKQIWCGAQNGTTMFLMNNIMNIHANQQGEDNVIFCHIREPEEIDKLCKMLDGFSIVGIDVTTLLITAETPFTSDETAISTAQADSFNSINNYTYDTVIRNDGTEQAFKSKAVDYITNLLVGKE